MIDPDDARGLVITSTGEADDYTLRSETNSVRVITHKANKLERFMFGSSKPCRISSPRFYFGMSETPSKEEDLSAFVLGAQHIIRDRFDFEQKNPSFRPPITFPPLIGLEVTTLQSSRTFPLIKALELFKFKRFTDYDYHEYLRANYPPCKGTEGFGANRYILPLKL